MKFYGAGELMVILGVSRSKAYEIIRKLRVDLESMGFLNSKAGRIQQSYFCERFRLSITDCDEFLHNVKNQKEAV